ncbi:MAG TPA: DUF1428 domain-containing protein [Albitalea sp.]|nr:DUF1428 domain-containing protein [Albitalea sp.]
MRPTRWRCKFRRELWSDCGFSWGDAVVEHARQLDPIFIELGAIRVIEGWGDDVPVGKLTDFRRAVQATAEETVAFSWIEWPDKATRDAAMKQIMDDPRMDPSTPGNPPTPFDGKRMIFGGFEPVVEVKA